MNSLKTPVHILSGFLGSGKTTFLNQLLNLPEFSNTLVIINEFGEVALDHLLVERSTDTIIELANGCLCCSIRGELVDTLQDVADLDCERIIIETTGIADPLPVMQAITAHPNLAAKLKLAATLVVFDLVRGENLIQEYQDARRQLALGDIILLTKADMLDEPAKSRNTQQAETLLKRINPSAVILNTCHHKSISPDILEINATPDIAADKITIGHDRTYKSTTLQCASPLPLAVIERIISHILGQYGDNILRIKGLVLTTEKPDQPLVLQVSGHIMHQPEYLKKWSPGAEKTALVVIVQDMDPSIIRRIFDSLSGKVSIDTPDFEAIDNNPLSVPGFNQS